MPKMTLEVPEEVAQLLRVLKAKLRREAEAGKSFGEMDPDGALKAIDEAAEALQRDAKRRCLCPHSHEELARPDPLFSGLHAHSTAARLSGGALPAEYLLSGVPTHAMADERP